MRRIMLAMLAAAAIVATAVPVQAGGGGGGCRAAEPVAGTGTKVGMAGNCFTPAALWVDPGTTVRFVNDDLVTHQVLGWRGGLGTGELGNGMSYEFEFTTPGVYPYACWLHPGMTGVVVVGSPQRPTATVNAPVPGVSGEIRGPEEAADTDSSPVAAKSTDAGTIGGAAALAGAAAGTIGFAAGRRRRETV